MVNKIALEKKKIKSKKITKKERTYHAGRRSSLCKQFQKWAQVDAWGFETADWSKFFLSSRLPYTAVERHPGAYCWSRGPPATGSWTARITAGRTSNGTNRAPQDIPEKRYPRDRQAPRYWLSLLLSDLLCYIPETLKHCNLSFVVDVIVIVFIAVECWCVTAPPVGFQRFRSVYHVVSSMELKLVFQFGLFIDSKYCSKIDHWSMTEGQAKCLIMMPNILDCFSWSHAWSLVSCWQRIETDIFFLVCHGTSRLCLDIDSF